MSLTTPHPSDQQEAPTCLKDMPRATQAQSIIRHIMNGREQGFHPQFCIGGTADQLQAILEEYIQLKSVEGYPAPAVPSHSEPRAWMRRWAL